MEMNSLKFRLIAIFLIFSLISVTSHKCGTQNYAAQFLVGAETAEDGQFPWKVAIFKNDDDQFLCGGSVIGQQHVLTAAHCILPNVQLKIQLGQHHLNITSKNSQTRFVESASIYKSYKASAKSSEGDIAIIKMDRKVEFNDFITPICLPRSNTSVESSFGTVVGHGQSENNSPELIPRFAELQTVSQEECYRNHHVLSTLITSNTFCAGGNGIGPCRGDSGGGFMLKDARVKQWTVVGVVSKGVLSNVGCNANNYVVFMKVFVEDVLNWILELVKDASFASVSLNFNITGFTEPASKLVPNTISKWSWMPKFVQPDLAFYINEGTIIDNLGYVIAHDKNLKVTDFKTKNNPGIEYLPILVDRKFPNLKVYKVKRCSVKTISFDNFEQLTKLEELDLSGNKIVSVFENSFDHLENLLKINLSQNKIKNLPENIFANCKLLNSFDFNHNQLEVLSAKHFESNRNLGEILLGENKISKLSPTMFAHMLSLHYVDLVNNYCISKYYAGVELNNLARDLGLACK